jgi:CRP-like cAMP-binding protein
MTLAGRHVKMKHYRYEYVTQDSLSRLNRILRRGWCPVREMDRKNGEADAAPALVLLEKESEHSSFAGGEILAGVPVDFLQNVMLFEDFTTDELRYVVNQCEVQSFEAGTQLFAPGDASESICIVLTGDVDVMLPELPVQGQAVVNLKPGGVFGESTFFSESPHTMSASAGDSGAALLVLDRIAYDEIFKEQPSAVLKLANNAARILAARLQETDEWVWDLLSQSQQAQISASWRRFRHRITGNDSSGGFFGV